jgi:hypothetical protein
MFVWTQVWARDHHHNSNGKTHLQIKKGSYTKDTGICKPMQVKVKENTEQGKINFLGGADRRSLRRITECEHQQRRRRINQCSKIFVA